LRVLLVVNGVFFNENMGVLSLSAVLKQAGHFPKLLVLNRHDSNRVLNVFNPDLVLIAP
jgi:hypothetical protein